MVPQFSYKSDVTHNFCVTYKKRTEPFNMSAFHYHNAYELYLFLSGERLLFYEQQLYHIAAGDIVFIPQGKLHCFTDDKTLGYEMLMVDFKENFLLDVGMEQADFLHCFKRDIVVMSPDLQQRQILRMKFEELLSEYQDTKPDRMVMMKLQLSSLLLYLSRQQDCFREKKEEIFRKQAVISQSMKYMEENYEKKVTLEALSECTGYSRTYLCSYFKKYTGITLMEYLNRLRIQKAQEYLRTSKMTVTEIAALCGFDDLTNFERMFRKRSGCTALQYRKLNLLPFI